VRRPPRAPFPAPPLHLFGRLHAVQKRRHAAFRVEQSRTRRHGRRQSRPYPAQRGAPTGHQRHGGVFEVLLRLPHQQPGREVLLAVRAPLPFI